jgi:hypothetical protein
MDSFRGNLSIHTLRKLPIPSPSKKKRNIRKASIKANCYRFHSPKSIPGYERLLTNLTPFIPLSLKERGKRFIERGFTPLVPTRGRRPPSLAKGRGQGDRLLNTYIDVWCINLIGGILKLRVNSRVKAVLNGRSSGT